MLQKRDDPQIFHFLFLGVCRGNDFADVSTACFVGFCDAQDFFGNLIALSRFAEKLGKSFVDTDEEICALGRTPAEIITNDGEDSFRKIESEICLEISKCNHTVISCGGGVIKNPLNIHALSLNGYVVYIKRNLNKLAMGGNRPLSTDRAALKTMAAERFHLYEKYSDAVVENNGYFGYALDNLMEVWNENTGY